MSESDTQRPRVAAALQSALVEAERWLVMTGSGVSAESGVPTFRDALTGLWEKYDPQDLATPDAFERNPELVWQWYQWRRTLIEDTKPNAAHIALAEIQARKPDLTLVTQNVDGLHQRAGSTGVIEFHGSIQKIKCFRCERPAEESREEFPPTCNDCGGLLRPDVVWFGEMIPAAALDEAAHAVEECDAFLSVGTSSLVYPAAALAETAVARRVLTVEINTNPTPLSAQADFALRGSAALWLPLIADCLRSDT